MSRIIVCGGVVFDSVQTQYGSDTYKTDLGGGAFTAATIIGRSSPGIVTLAAEISNDAIGAQFVTASEANNIHLIPELIGVDRPTRAAIWKLDEKGDKKLDQGASRLSPQGENRLHLLAGLNLGEPEIIILCSSGLTMEWAKGWDKLVANHEGALIVSSFNTRAFKDDKDDVPNPLTAEEKRAIYMPNFREQMRLSDIVFFATKDLECLLPDTSREDVIKFLRECNPDCPIVVTNSGNPTDYYAFGESTPISIPVDTLALSPDANKVGTGDVTVAGAALVLLKDAYDMPKAILAGHQESRNYLIRRNNIQLSAQPGGAPSP